MLLLAGIKNGTNQDAKTCEHQTQPQSHMRIVAGLRAVWMVGRDLIVMDIDRQRFISGQLDLKRIRAFIPGADAVLNFRHGIFADAQVFNEDLTVCVGRENFIIILTRDTEAEAFHTAVRGGLHDLQIADHMVVDEANAGFVLYFHHLAISYDFKIVVSVVLDIVYRCLLFIEEVSAVTQLGEFVKARLTFRKGADQFIHIRIELLIFVYITVDLKHSPGKQMVGIILIDLSRMDCAIDVAVLSLDLDYGTIRSNVDRELCLVENEALGRFQLAHDPLL